ncbi:MAG TPA: AraC family transcriptional regulator [Sphingobacteriaceae bacterium]
MFQLRSQVLFQSDFYQVKNWEYDFGDERKPTNGFNDCLCFVYVKKGSFLFDLAKDSYDIHSGYIVIDKPNYEYSLRPSAGDCSIFNFTNDFYRQLLEDLNLKYSFFFGNNNILSLLLKANPEIDYLHHQIMKRSIQGGKLEVDNLVIELLRSIIALITNSSAEAEINDSLRKYHLKTIEKAKEYIQEHFPKDISLCEISGYACVSPFHFSRVFKQLTSYTPHQYLQNVRLKHGEMMLKSGNLPIADISILSGFNTAEYFATAFRQKYKMSPTDYRSAVLK